MEPHRQIAEFIKVGSMTAQLLAQGVRLTEGEKKSLQETMERLQNRLTGLRQQSLGHLVKNR